MTTQLSLFTEHRAPRGMGVTMSVPVQYDDVEPPTLSDALSISVLLRLMASTTTTATPDLPLYRVSGLVEATLLGSAAYDSRRARQIVVIARHRQYGYPVDPARLAAELRHAAVDVVFLGDGGITAEAVFESLTRSLGVPPGAVRVLRPDMAEDDPQTRHPLLRRTEYGPDEMYEQVLKVVNAGGTATRRRALAPVQALPRAKGVTESEVIRGLRDKLKETGKALRTAQEQLAAEARPVFRDGYAQFRHDLHRAWLVATEEGDRERWPLREFALGAEFLDSIEAQQLVDRGRVIRACVDVITGRHAEINSRESHRLRVNEGGSSPAVRRPDGSIAWRCAVQTVGASAPRLMWWERADGVVELAAVRPHDDCRIV